MIPTYGALQIMKSGQHNCIAQCFFSTHEIRCKWKKFLIWCRYCEIFEIKLSVQSKSLFTAPARCRREECWRTDWSNSFSSRDTDSEKLAWMQNIMKCPSSHGLEFVLHFSFDYNKASVSGVSINSNSGVFFINRPCSFYKKKKDLFS